MRASGDAMAITDGIGDLDTVWLRPRVSRTVSAPSRGRLRRIERLGAAAGRLSALVVGGVLLSALLPGFALAPVGVAQASVEQFLVRPPAPEPVTLPFGPGDGPNPFAAPPPLPRPADDRLRFGSRELPRELVESVLRAATATGVDAIYLMALADKESSFRTSVKAPTSSAEGLFQFIDRTWLDVVHRFGGDHGLAMEADAVTVENDRPVVEDEAMRTRILEMRREPYLAAVMAAELLKHDAAEIGNRTGRILNPTERYLAHFLGRQDASRFLTLLGSRKAPLAARAFPAAARANAAIFFERGRRRPRSRSLAEVYERIRGMIDPRLLRYKDVEAYGSATRG